MRWIAGVVVWLSIILFIALFGFGMLNTSLLSLFPVVCVENLKPRVRNALKRVMFFCAY